MVLKDVPKWADEKDDLKKSEKKTSTAKATTTMLSLKDISNVGCDVGGGCSGEKDESPNCSGSTGKRPPGSENSKDIEKK